MALSIIGNDSSYMRQELRNMRLMYELLDDCLAGSIQVKYRAARYLPIPNPQDVGPDNLKRYLAYKTRAVFYGVTRRTLSGFIGEMFDTDPLIQVPPAMEDIIEDTTGEGVGITQMAKAVASLVLSMGRSGLFVDYPDTKGVGASVDDVENGVRPIIRYYHPLKILNWRHKKVGALYKLCLVVLEEEYDMPALTFDIRKGRQWRILRLGDDNIYTVELYKDVTGRVSVDEQGNVAPINTPLDANGKPFDTIPFTFVGAETNTAKIDYPPMFDMADINLAHYRNSADYEEAVFLCGQPTPVLIGLTEDWVARYYSTGIALGSRAAIPLPVGADAKLLEVTQQTMAKEAMEMKERQMVALGAKLVEQTTVQRTASEASIEVASEMSVLAAVAVNVSIAFEWALSYAARFVGVPDDDIKFELNKEFSISFADALSRDEVIKAWVSEAISWTEMRSALRKGGLASLDDEKARAEIKMDAGNGDGPGVAGAGGFDANGNPIPPTVGLPVAAPDPGSSPAAVKTLGD
jgi:hypothetical protein